MTELQIFRESIAARDGLIRIGTRGSALAVSQTSDVARRIAATTDTEVVLVIVKTFGDVSTAPLSQLGGTGVFVSALREALLRGECDLAVHSLKDLPTAPCPGITLGAVPERADARDALISRESRPLDALPAGARVGTGSPRRAAQLLSRRPDLEVCDLRGNIDTRLARVDNDLDAVILAVAGLERLGRDEVIAERFALDVAPPAPGQGALAIEHRTDDPSPLIAEAIAQLDDPDDRACAVAERALLAGLEAGCAAPVGAHCRVSTGRLELHGAVYSLDGSRTLSSLRSVPWKGIDSEDVGPADAKALALGAETAEALLDDGARLIAPLGPTA